MRLLNCLLAVGARADELRVIVGVTAHVMLARRVGPPDIFDAVSVGD
jgi:hypothetical protein